MRVSGPEPQQLKRAGHEGLRSPPQTLGLKRKRRHITTRRSEGDATPLSFNRQPPLAALYQTHSNTYAGMERLYFWGLPEFL